MLLDLDNAQQSCTNKRASESRLHHERQMIITRGRGRRRRSLLLSSQGVNPKVNPTQRLR